jgi:peptidoglycan hydrolase CwlO-like protein
MGRIILALVIALVCISPALASDIGRKQQIDTKISTLQDRLSAQKQQEQSLRSEVAGFTSRIRSLEARVGDVTLRLTTLESDLSLHQRRLDVLNALFGLQTKRLAFLKQQYTTAVATLNRRLVDIYESEPASTIDVVLGARSIQDALDQVQYLNEIGEQDRRIAAQVHYASSRSRLHARRPRSSAQQSRARQR